MKIAVMGAGAIGSYLGARLAAAGESVTFVARGPHLDAMRRGGLRVESPVGDLHLTEVSATDQPSSVGPVDIVIFAVKLWDAEKAAADIVPLVAEETRVVTLQNGIDGVELVAISVPREKIRAGVIYISAKMAGHGLIVNPGGQRRLIVDAASGDPVISNFGEVCRRTKGIEIELTDAIDMAMWQKFAVNSAFSAITSITRSSMGPIMANAEARNLLRQLLEESCAVAAASGITLDTGLVEAAMASFARLPPEIRASMAEDLHRGRRLELRWSSGRIHALGIELGVSTPAHTAVYRALALHANGTG